MGSDASGSWGCGAWFGHEWFQLRWDARSFHLPITVKELLPIVLADAIWGPTWSNCCITCHCDNQAVIACLRSRTSHECHIMHMLRTLSFLEAKYSFSLSPVYISSKANDLADEPVKE